MKVGLNRRQGGAQIACRWGWGDDFCNLSPEIYLKHSILLYGRILVCFPRKIFDPLLTLQCSLIYDFLSKCTPFRVIELPKSKWSIHSFIFLIISITLPHISQIHFLYARKSPTGKKHINKSFLNNEFISFNIESNLLPERTPSLAKPTNDFINTTGSYFK